MTIDEAKIFIQNAMEQSRNALAELMLIMPKVFAAKRKSLGEYYSNLENCKKEIQACEIAVKALEEVQQYRAIGTVEECRAAIALRDYPTAYDPDKVVEQLKKRSEEYNSGVRLHGKPEEMLTDEAIEIVKGGGVDAKTDS